MSHLLSSADVKLLIKCEDAIASNKAGFIAAGNALQTIRDRRLFRASHETFAAYCVDRWGFSDSHAREMILAGDATVVDPSVDVVAATKKKKAKKDRVETQALEPEEREALSGVVEEPTHTDPLTGAKEAFAEIEAMFKTFRHEMLRRTDWLIGRHLSKAGITSCMNNLKEEIKWGSPAMACPHGEDGEQHGASCACRGTGWIPQSQARQEKK